MTNPISPHSRDEAPAASGPRTRERLLADVFVMLADTLVADFDVVEMLEQLVRACVETLGSTAAGLLLGDHRGNLMVMAASTESTRLLEVLQIQNDEGPCLDCYRTRKPVTVPDLAAAVDRWPRFVPAALDRGYHSVHALPMRLRETTIGALNLFQATGPLLGAEELRIAQALADTATIGILQQRALQASNLLAEQLQSALNSRVAIEQAKGVLAAYTGSDMDEAFGALRRYARDHNLRLSDVARSVATRTVDPLVILGGNRER